MKHGGRLVWVALGCGAPVACATEDRVSLTGLSEEVGELGPEEAGSAEASGRSEPELFSFECAEEAGRSSTPPEEASEGPSLRDAGRLVGVAVSAARLQDPAYAQTIVDHFNQITPENEMKWETIEPSPGVFDFGPADTIVAFARDNGMQVRGHTLVWHSQLPAWVNALSGPAAVLEAMSRHIQVVVSHYRDEFPGTVVAWDVVNEAIDTPGGVAGYRDTIFHRELGDGYIERAFRLAREADPDALLFYNDFGIEGLFGGKANAAFNMISALARAGVPIDGVGLQMHTVPDDRGPGLGELQGNLARYAELGLLIDVTEMDVSLCGIGNSAFALELQRFRYNRIASACVAEPACRSIALWGVSDASSWLNDTGCNAAAGETLPMPLAFDDGYAPKPAWWGLYDALTGCSYR